MTPLVLRELSTKATLDSLSLSLSSDEGTIEPVSLSYEPSIEGTNAESTPHQPARTPTHQYEKLRRGEN